MRPGETRQAERGLAEQQHHGRITLSAGRAGRSRRKKKNDGRGFEPATLANAVGLLARRSLTRCRKCPEADGNPGSSPGGDISLGQSEEKKTCLHHCIISRILQLDSL